MNPHILRKAGVSNDTATIEQLVATAPWCLRRVHSVDSFGAWSEMYDALEVDQQTTVRNRLSSEQIQVLLLGTMQNEKAAALERERSMSAHPAIMPTQQYR